MHHATLIIVEEASSEEEAINEAELKLQPFSEHIETEPRFNAYLEFTDYYESLKSFGDDLSEEEARVNFDNPVESELERLRDYFGEELVIEDGKYVEMTTMNPDGQWDWYELGGRWDAYLPHKRSSKGVNVLQKKDLDIENAQHLAVTSAIVEYDKFIAATEGIDIPPSLQEIMDTTDPALPAYKRKQLAVQTYRNSEWVKAAEEVVPRQFIFPHDYFFVNKGGKEAFIHNASRSFILTNAVVTPDDEWIENGYWVSYSDSEQWPDHGKWADSFWEIIQGLSDDAWLLIYDLHS